MPNRRESMQPGRWFAKARSDLERVPIRLAEGDWEDAAIHLQQALEKYLKGYLLSKGWELKRVHDLEFLLDETLVFDAELDRFRDLCQEVTGYYLAQRYPFLPEGPSREEIEANLERANQLVQHLEGRET